MAESLGTRALKGTVWATVDRFGNMVLQFVVNLLLARLLLPADFGVIGVFAIFIAVSQTLIDGGFTSSLIQRKSPSQRDYSTIFYWNLAFSLLLYGALFLAAPAVAAYFRLPVLRDVMRAVGINLVISALAQVQLVRMKKELSFRRLAVVNLTSYLVASVIAVYMACRGAGVWSLVAMTVINQSMVTVMYWLMNRWRPSLCFSLQSFRSLFGYGGYMLAAALLQEVCRNLQGVIIGRRFSATELGLYSQAYKLDQVTSYAVPQVLVQVLFPFFSNLQDNRERLIEMTAMGMRVISALVFPVLLLLVIVAEPLVTGLYGDVWAPCVPYFRILCVGGVFVSLQNVNFYAVASLGYSKLLFKWSFYKWGCLLALLLGGMMFGMDGIMWAIVVSNFNIFMVNVLLSAKCVGFSVSAQFRSVMPAFGAALTAGAVSWLVPEGRWLLGATLFVVVYVAVVVAFRLKVIGDFRRVIGIIRGKK